MRRFLLLLGLALVVGGGLYYLMASYQGFVLIALGNYVIETSLWSALLLLAALTLLVYGLIRLWTLVRLPGHWFRHRAVRRRRHQREKTVQGLLAYFEGNWPVAARDFAAGASHSGMATVNYLGAASASFNAGDRAGAVDWLARAGKAGADEELAAGLLQTRLHLMQGEFDQALSRVRRLHARAPHHPGVLRLLASTYKAKRDWSRIEALLPDLRRSGALSSTELEELEVEVYSALIEGFAAKLDANKGREERLAALNELWDDVPRRWRGHPRLVAAFIRELQGAGFSDKAEAQLRRHLNKDWSEDLVILYGHLPADAERQLRTAEKWLARHPDDPALLRVLGHLCRRNQLWGKARDYLEHSLTLEPSPMAYRQLAELLEAVGEDEAAAQCYQRGLAVALGNAGSDQLPVR